jgi:uncharacterized protein YqiB (DUF1249 family)
MPRHKYTIDLIKQMAECDANYIRLLKLVPQLSAYQDKSFLDYLLPEKDSADKKKQELGQYSSEPEKILEGLFTEFCIADLRNQNGKVTVEIKILEAFKYTTTLEIIQKQELKEWMTNPSMLVRAYHDASTAEVISYQGHKNFKSRYFQPNKKMYQSDEKIQINAFLGEWLSHCLEVGRSLASPEIVFSA